MSYFINWVKYSLVHAVVVFLTRWSEYFCLHSGSHDPEWVGDDITEKATHAGRGGIQRIRVLFPPVFFTEVDLALLIQREVYRMKQGDAEDWHWITYKSQSMISWHYWNWGTPIIDLEREEGPLTYLDTIPCNLHGLRRSWGFSCWTLCVPFNPIDEKC